MAGAPGVQIVLQPPVSFILKQTGAFKRALLDLSPLWEKFKPVMSAIEQQRFSSEGPGWAPLAQSTIERRLALGFGAGPILQNTRTLMDSLVDPGRAAKTGRSQMEWGTDVPYAIYHQDGTPRMPARPVLDISTDDRRRLEASMVGWLNEVASRTFGRI